jgi:hypothetical protein
MAQGDRHDQTMWVGRVLGIMPVGLCLLCRQIQFRLRHLCPISAKSGPWTQAFALGLAVIVSGLVLAKDRAL